MVKLKKILSGVIASCVMLTSSLISSMSISAAYQRVSVHDPSVIKLSDGSYFIAGSHLSAASSKDLKNWTVAANSNLGTKNTTFFKDIYTDLAIPAKWSNTSNGYDLSGNLWAPDIIYNPKMKKYCMYLSVNGNDWHSSIVLCTADKVDGPYTYKDTIVYSGFETDPANAMNSYKNTDVERVLGSNPDLSRYLTNGRWNSAYGTNAIDPCVFYDEQGKLWMIYGSWFGGLYMLELDENTGLRDYNVKYQTKANVSDAYMGKKAAGGWWNSGEGPYIEYMKDPVTGKGYYYLFVSYGWFNTYGGYNMRVFRSSNPDGPYVDENGNSAIYTKAASDNVHNNTNGWTGMRLMANYQWSCNKEPFRAQGHNSALMDNDGKLYVIYHTKFDNYNPGFHEVRVHQLIMNEDGWITAAPYEYSGESLSPNGHSVKAISGEYEFIFHSPNQDFTNEQYANVDKPCKAILNENGTVTGDISGTWTMKNGTPYMSLTYGDITYKGAFLVQSDESDSMIKKMTFTATANNACIWGSKKAAYNAAEDTTSTQAAAFAEASTYRIKNVHSGKYLGIDLSKSSNSNAFQCDENNSGGETLWRLFSAGDGYYYLISNTGDGASMALDINGKKTSNGTNIAGYNFNGNDNQKFMMTKNPDGSYKILTKITNCQSAVEVENAQSQSGANVQQWANNGADCQDWIFEKAEEPGIEMNTSFIYTFKNKISGLVMDIKDGKTENNSNIQQWDSNGFDCQQWVLKPFTGGGNYYYIHSLRDEKYVLRSQGDTNGGNLALAEYSGNDSSMLFKFAMNLDGTYRIMTRSSKDGKLLEVANASNEPGANIAQWEPNGNDCQKWIAVTDTKITTASTVTTTVSTTTTTSATTPTAPINNILKGDVDNDKEIRLTDIIMLRKYLVKNGDLTSPINADMNDDGKVNVIDLLILKRSIGIK